MFDHIRHRQTRLDEEWENMRGEPPFDRFRADRESADQAFRSEDWSLGNVFSWIGFHDPKLICRFEARWTDGHRREPRYLTSRQRLILHKLSAGRKGRQQTKLVVGHPDHALLAALKAGKLTAIRNGKGLSRCYWAGKDVRDLTDDLRFWRAEATTIDWWSAESDAPSAAAARDNDAAEIVPEPTAVHRPAMAEAEMPSTFADGQATSPLPPRGKRRDAMLAEWARTAFGEHLAQMPGRAGLLTLARANFGDDVNQGDVRELRRLAPDKLRRGGKPTHRNK
jgi:hypothetical protein